MDFSFIPLALTEMVSPTTAAYALATLGLSIHFGYTGLLNFGQAGFMAVGGYFFAVSTLSFGFPLWAGVIMAILGAVVFALLLGIPTLRLRADYLSIVTIAAAEIVRLTVKTPVLDPWTGSSEGLNSFADGFFDLNPIPRGYYALGPIAFSANDLWTMIWGWSLVIVVALAVWRLMASPWGRVLKGIREDEDAVRSLGKNVFSYKMQSLIIGGVIAGLAGLVFIMPRSLQPDNYGTQLTFFLWTIMFLGGATSVFGPIIGSMIFWGGLVLMEGVANGLVAIGWLPITGIQVGQIRFILVGVLLMLLVIFRPQGIFGKRSETYFNV